MNKKKRNLCLFLGLIFCMFLSNTTIFANSKTKGNVVQPEKVQLEDATNFSKANGVSSFEIKGNVETISLNTKGNNIDVNQAIKDIEAGIILPLSKGNLPDGIDASSAMDFEDTKGSSSHVELNEISTLANCSHVYTPGVFSSHAKYTDGSCSTDSYDALRCYKCNTIWVLEIIGTSTYRVCPH